MKYNEFLQLEKLLSENKLTFKDVKKNEPQVLNESILGIIIGSFAALMGLSALFSKNLIRLGIKKTYLSKIKNIAEEFKENLLDKVTEMAQNSSSLRQSIFQKEKQLKAGNEENKFELHTLKNQRKQIDKNVIKELNDFIVKQTNSKTKEIYQKVDELKRLKDSEKLALKSYWDGYVPNIKIEAFKRMIENGIITDIGLIKQIKTHLIKNQKNIKDKLNNIQDEIKEDIKREKETKQESKQESTEQYKETKQPEKKIVDERPEQKILKKEDNL